MKQELQRQFEIAQPVINELLQLRAATQESGATSNEERMLLHALRGVGVHRLDSVDDLTMGVVTALISVTEFSTQQVGSDKVYHPSCAAKLLDTDDDGNIVSSKAMTLYGSLLIMRDILRQPATNSVLSSDDKFAKKRKKAVKAAQFDYLCSMIEVYGMQQAPNPDVLTENDVYALSLAETVHADLDNDSHSYAISDVLACPNVLKRGIVLRNRYQTVASDRKALGVLLDIHPDAIISTRVPAGYIGATEAYYMLGIALRS